MPIVHTRVLQGPLGMLVIGLVLGPSLMVISITGILLYPKVSPLYNVLWECIVIVYT